MAVMTPTNVPAEQTCLQIEITKLLETVCNLEDVVYCDDRNAKVDGSAPLGKSTSAWDVALTEHLSELDAVRQRISDVTNMIRNIRELTQ